MQITPPGAVDPTQPTPLPTPEAPPVAPPVAEAAAAPVPVETPAAAPAPVPEPPKPNIAEIPETPPVVQPPVAPTAETAGAPAVDPNVAAVDASLKQGEHAGLENALLNNSTSSAAQPEPVVAPEAAENIAEVAEGDVATPAEPGNVPPPTAAIEIGPDTATPAAATEPVATAEPVIPPVETPAPPLAAEPASAPTSEVLGRIQPETTAEQGGDVNAQIERYNEASAAQSAEFIKLLQMLASKNDQATEQGNGIAKAA